MSNESDANFYPISRDSCPGHTTLLNFTTPIYLPLGILVVTTHCLIVVERFFGCGEMIFDFGETMVCFQVGCGETMVCFQLGCCETMVCFQLGCGETMVSFQIGCGETMRVSMPDSLLEMVSANSIFTQVPLGSSNREKTPLETPFKHSQSINYAPNTGN